MKIYMEVTRDKYEFLVAVANNVEELARIVGVKKSTIKSDISHKRGRFIRIEVENEQDGKSN